MSELITPLSPQDIFAESSTQGLPLGSRGETKDGRQFRYALVGGTALVAGNLLQSPAQVANHLSLAVASAAAIGAAEVTVTLGGTAATANQYREGYLVTSSTPGHGYSYKIKSHPAQSTTTGNVTLTLEDPLLVALTTKRFVTIPMLRSFRVHFKLCFGKDSTCVYSEREIYYVFIYIYRY